MKLDIQGSCFAKAKDSREVKALCAYEGQFKSQQGRIKAFTAELLQGMIAASNDHLNSGVQVPVFSSGIGDHHYASNAKIGIVTGPFEGKVITEDDLPDPRMTDLIGKFGIFTQLKITKAEAIEDYDAELLKPISIGVDFAGNMYPENSIFEISCVGFSAVPGAMLFGRSLPDDVDLMALAQEALTLSESATFSLTLNDRLAKEDLMPGLWRLFDAFTELIREIYDEEDVTEDEKKALIKQAISDLAVGVASRIQTVQPKPAPPVTVEPEQFSSTPDPDPEEIEDMGQIEDLKAQVAALELRSSVSDTYAAMIAKASDLFSKRLITPAQLKEFEAASDGADSVIQTFAASGLEPNDQPASALDSLRRKMVELETIEKYGRPHAANHFNSQLQNQPLPTEDGETNDADSFLSTYSVRSPLYPNPVEVVTHANQ